MAAEITEQVNAMTLNETPQPPATPDLRPRTNKIQVSNTKKPLYFYINLAKRFLRTEEEVELSALGNAISTVVTIAEILKENGLVEVTKINTSTVDMNETNRYRPVQKAKIQINLKKSEKFFDLVDQAPVKKAQPAE